MSFERPTLSQLIDRAQDDYNARLPGADSRLRRSTLSVMATVHSGAVHGLYGYLDYLANQILPDRADAEHLDRWAGVFSILRKPATLCSGAVTVTGVNGSTIPAGTVLQRGQGVEYVVQAAAVIAGGTASLAVAAATPGAASAADAGVRLAFVSPVAGVNASAVVAVDGLTGGADEESDDLVRERLLARIRQAPAGGARHDYVGWALEVAEVTRAWVYPGWVGAGTVGVAFVMDARMDPIPTEDDVAVVQAHLDGLAPVTAEVVVIAPTAYPVNLTITALTPGDAATRDAVTAEVRDLLMREGQPGGTILVSRLREAISQAAGETDHVLTSPSANVTAPAGQLPVLGAITWG